MKNDITQCRVCAAPISQLMSYGKMPIANGFIKEITEDEYFFDLSVGFCNSCNTFQLLQQPEPEQMFHEEYAFFSRQSKSMQSHFKKYADWVMENYMNEGDFIVEIGSNDGIMLENFSKKGFNHLGIDPSANVVSEALSHGVNSEVMFFGMDTSEQVKNNYGKAAAIISANVKLSISSGPTKLNLGHFALPKSPLCL